MLSENRILKSKENVLRRMAERRGYKLARCKRRDPFALGFGLYALTDVARGNVPLTPVIGGSPYSETLDQIERRLNELVKQ